MLRRPPRRSCGDSSRGYGRPRSSSSSVCRLAMFSRSLGGDRLIPPGDRDTDTPPVLEAIGRVILMRRHARAMESDLSAVLKLIGLTRLLVYLIC